MIEALRKGGLQRKIFMLMLVVGIIPGIVGVTAVYFMGNRLVMQSVGPGLAGTAKKAASELDTIIQYEFSYAGQLANLAYIREFVKKANDRYLSKDAGQLLKEKESLWKSGNSAIFKDILENETAVFLRSAVSGPKEPCHIAVIDAKGGLIVSTEPVSEFSYGKEGWWQESMGGRNYVGGPMPCGAGKGFNTFHFTVPILAPKDKAVIGVLYMERRSDDVLASLKAFRYGKTGHLEIVNTKGSYIMEALGAEREPAPEWLIKEISDKKRGWAIGVDEHGNYSAKGFAPSGFNGWHVVLNQQMSEIIAPMKSLMMGATIPGFFTVLVLAFIWFNLSRRIILRPISNLSEGASQIGHGNFDYRLDIKTGDELEHLAHEFNAMAENLKISQERLARWNEELRDEVAKRTVEIEEANEELRDSKEELEASRDELERRNEDLASANMRLREMDRLKSEFLANMSHELRTPLTAIIGFSELLIDRVMGDLNEEQAGCLDNVLTSGQHLLKLINDILDLSKIEAGKMELHMETFDLRTIVGSVEKTVSPLVEKNGQALRVEMEEGMPEIYADPVKIKQLLLNLVGNAIKFTPNGGAITVGAGFKDDCFAISVTDTGIGIKPEDRERIFQEFQQAEGSTSREYGGTGLGLTLTKRLTEMHGGRIELESEIGKGSKFTAYLPLRIEERPSFKEEKVEKKPEVKLLPAPQQRPETQPLILVVEDDPKLSRLLSVYLEQAGYRVETAMDGEEAIKKAAELQPFAITLDIMLPGKDGWEVLQYLKGMPETRDIPVTIVSMVEDREIGFSLGAADYLVKPVSRETLLESIGRYSYTPKVVTRGAVRVLVVDDDPKILEFLSAVLRKEGFHVSTASGGEEGIRMALEDIPDLIILDLMMPKVSGFDVIKELKRHPVAMDIPIFVLTAKDLSREEKERLLLDVARVVQKGGVSKEELIEEIKRMEILLPERAGLVDRITGLFDYRYFEIRLSHEVNRSQRYGRGFSVSLLDVDSFGHYNEVNGYTYGDMVLRDMARLLGKNLRRADIEMRYKGGRFAVILPETAKEAAMAVADKIRSLIEGYPFPKRESQPLGRLTVSISVAAYPVDGKRAGELIEGLERAGARAEEMGGNRVVDAGEAL